MHYCESEVISMSKKLLIINLVFVLLIASFASTSSANNLYRNDKHKFRITFPEGWKVERGSGPNTVVIASDNKGSSININITKTDSNNSADMLSLELIPELLKALQSAYSDVELLDKSETYICNRKALMIKYNGTYKHIKASPRMTVLTFVTVNNGHMFTITCGTGLALYRNYKKAFVDSVSTLVFEDFIIDRSPVGTTNDSQVDYEDLDHFVNSIKKIYPNNKIIISNSKFKEYIRSLPDKEIKAIHKISRTEAERIYESGTAEEIIQLVSNYKINKVHPDYPEIIYTQMFKDYVNNLPWQQIRPTTRIMESGTAEDIIQIITNYKSQKDYQESHRLMIKEVIDNYSVFDESSAISILQDWINKEGDSAKVIRLSVKDSNSYGQENSHLVTYTIARGSNKQKSSYKFNLYANVCQKVVD
jgi:hypothetical protein